MAAINIDYSTWFLTIFGLVMTLTFDFSVNDHTRMHMNGQPKNKVPSMANYWQRHVNHNNVKYLY